HGQDQNRIDLRCGRGAARLVPPQGEQAAFLRRASHARHGTFIDRERDRHRPREDRRRSERRNRSYLLLKLKPLRSEHTNPAGRRRWGSFVPGRVPIGASGGSASATRQRPPSRTPWTSATSAGLAPNTVTRAQSSLVSTSERVGSKRSETRE